MLRASFVVVKIMELVLIYDESWFRCKLLYMQGKLEADMT